METGQGLVDPWTLVHTSVGAAAGVVGLNPWIYGGLIVLYEVIENGGGAKFRKSIFNASGPESQLKAIVDIAVGLLGYAAARRLKEK